MKLPNTQRSRNYNTYIWRQKNQVVKTAHNKSRSKSFTTLSINFFMYHQALPLHYARISVQYYLFSSNCSVLCSRPDDNCILPGMPAHTVSTVMCSQLHGVHCVCHWSTQSLSVLRVANKRCHKSLWALLYIKQCNFHTQKRGAVEDPRKTRVKNAYPLTINRRWEAQCMNWRCSKHIMNKKERRLHQGTRFWHMKGLLCF